MLHLAVGPFEFRADQILEHCTDDHGAGRFALTDFGLLEQIAEGGAQAGLRIESHDQRFAREEELDPGNPECLNLVQVERAVAFGMELIEQGDVGGHLAHGAAAGLAAFFGEHPVHAVAGKHLVDLAVAEPENLSLLLQFAGGEHGSPDMAAAKIRILRNLSGDPSANLPKD